MVQIPRIVIDPADDEALLADMYTRAINASGGTLTDARVSSPLAAIFEGVAYSISELLWYANLLPEAVALEVMRYATGLERLDATYAQGTFTFSLLEVRGNDFVIDTTFRVPYLDAYYSPLAPVVIPAGYYEIEAVMKCSVAGSKYNIPYTLGLNSTSPALTGLGRVYNTAPVTNAADLEPLETTLSRMQHYLRSRNTLLSQDDYELALVTMAGNGSLVKAIPLMDSNKVKGVTGHVHCFLIKSDGTLPTLTECAAYRDTLTEQVFAGSLVWVSPFVFETVDIQMVIEVTEVTQPLANIIGAVITNYLNPLTYTSQRVRVQDLEFTARKASDSVLGVDMCLINGSQLDYPLGTEWTLPELNILNVTLTDGRATQTYYLGIVDEAE